MKNIQSTFILPFINTLGYASFKPKEVFAAFKSELELKKSEKIGDAIFKMCYEF